MIYHEICNRYFVELYDNFLHDKSIKVDSYHEIHDMNLSVDGRLVGMRIGPLRTTNLVFKTFTQFYRCKYDRNENNNNPVRVLARGRFQTGSVIFTGLFIMEKIGEDRSTKDGEYKILTLQ